MRKRFTWIAAVLALVSFGLLVACKTTYSSSSIANGLVVSPRLANQVMQTFSIDLKNGAVAQINNDSWPAHDGIPDAGAP